LLTRNISTLSQWIATAKQHPNVQLQLSTNIREQRYSFEAGVRLVRLSLNLNYSNRGTEPILLDKKSLLVYRRMVSQDLKAASRKKYNQDILSSVIDFESLRAAGMHFDTTPEKEAFVKLNPGESFSLEKIVFFQLYDGTKDSEDDLNPGTYSYRSKLRLGITVPILRYIARNGRGWAIYGGTICFQLRCRLQ
jgi:hypothetical protein